MSEIMLTHAQSHICQYIEVRRLTTRNSGIWLSIQGALALIRVAVWVWDPQFDYPRIYGTDCIVEEYRRTEERKDYGLTAARMIVLWATSELRDKYWKCYTHGKSSLIMPEWVLPAFQLGDRNPTGTFVLAQKLRQDSSEWDVSFEMLRGAESCWITPNWLSMAWIDTCLGPNLPPDRKNRNNFTCRVIRDNKQNFHFIPCWHSSITLVARRIDQGEIYTGDEFKDPKVRGKLAATSVVFWCG